MRRASVVLLTLLVAVTAGALVPAAPGDRSTPGDTDGDRLFDRLERKLEDKDPGDEVRVIVTLRDPATAERTRRLADAVGDVDVRRRFSIIPAFAATATKAEAAALAKRPEVAHVEEDRPVRAFMDTAKAAYGVTEARIDTGVDGDVVGGPDTYSKDDLVAAVIDTGIDSSHPDLNDGKVLKSVNCLLPGCPDGGEDDNEHGTHVAGILAGDGEGTSDRRYRGVAPGAALVSVKVLDAAGSGFTSNVVAGIEWAQANRTTYGIEALNISLGGSGCSGDDEADAEAANAASAAGLVVVAAAGNDGPDPCTVGSPGSASGALTVGSMADYGRPGEPPTGFHLVFDSSRGPTTDNRIKPDVVAPGEEITSANGNPVTKNVEPYQTLSGTSMATPFVAGVALLMLDRAGGLTPQEVKTKIMQTAVDWGRGGVSATPAAGSTGPDVDYGAGRLDAYQAINAAAGGLTSPPTTPAHLFQEGTLADRQSVDYDVTVTDTTCPLAATLIMPSWDTPGRVEPDDDFDLYWIDPGGNEVASAEHVAARQEELGHRPATTGTYRLRVTSFEGGGDYFVDISAGTAGSGPCVVSADPGPSGSAGGSGGGGSGGGGGQTQPDGGSAQTTGPGDTRSGAPAPPPRARDTRRPALRLGGSTRQRALRSRSILLLFRPNESVKARFTARVSVSGSSRAFRLRAIRRSVPGGRRARVRFALSRRQLRVIRRALARRRRVTATLRVSAVDGAGNRSIARRRVRLRR